MTDPAAERYGLRPMTVADLQSVLDLRNHADIRRYMLNKHEIKYDEHENWFSEASTNPGSKLFVFELDGVCCGFVQFKNTKYQGVVDWGFYTSPDAPKGTGRKLGLAALHQAYAGSGIHKICGQAFNWNRKSINFHKSLGFTQEGVLRNHHFDGSSYHDLVCFGQLKSEWVARRISTGPKNDHDR